MVIGRVIEKIGYGLHIKTCRLERLHGNRQLQAMQGTVVLSRNTFVVDHTEYAAGLQSAKHIAKKRLRCLVAAVVQVVQVQCRDCGVDLYVQCQAADFGENGPEVAKAIAEIDGVDSSEAVTGPYDVIVAAKAADVDALGHLVVTQIQPVVGIVRTLTCPVVRL